MGTSDSQDFSSFVTGAKTFEIPPYQRNYSWEREQVDDLWSDLIEAVAMDRDHYIGTFLLMDPEDGETVQVIDGQQRLTTLTVLLYELQRRLDERGDERKARQIRGDYLARYSGQKLRLAGDDEEFFRRKILQNLLDDDGTGRVEIDLDDVDTNSPSQARLLETKRYLRERLAGGVPDGAAAKTLTAFLDALFETIRSLPLLQYTVDSRSEAARIFQTVNDRGKDLTDLEITKSYLMHRISLLEDDDRADELIRTVQEEFNDIYDAVENVQSGPSEDRIQRYHFIAWHPGWNTGYGNRYYQSHLTHVKESFRSVADADEILDYVHELSGIFQRVDELVNRKNIPGRRTEERLRRLFLAGRLGNFYPLLLVAYDQFRDADRDVTESQFNRLVAQIESFIVRTYLVERKSADTGRTRVYPLARRLYYNGADEVPDHVDPMTVSAVTERIGSYTERYCDDDQLASTLGESNVYDSYASSNRLKELRLLLYAHEAALEAERECLPFDLYDVVNNVRNRYSVEHVWPQTPSEDLPEERRERIRENTHRLGNLALMTPEDNAAMGNDPFDEKRRRFDGSKVRMLNDVFGRNETWGVPEIDERESRMLRHIRERWPVHVE